MDNREWFRQAKFGMMVHFGLYSIPAGEWKGQRMPYIGEWLQAYYRIPNKEYHQLTKVFNPIYFDAEEWVLLAKRAGMQYMVVTSKHHEGFALFHSKADSFNVVDATPFGRDIIKELAEACYKHGLKFGLYYSQELDWAHPHGGGYKNIPFLNLEETTSWTNDWDFPDEEKKDFSICFEEKIKPQMQEILTNYGDLSVLWCDTPISISPEQSRDLYALIKRYQPNCLVNSRIGNGVGDFESSGDNEMILKTSAEKLYDMPGTINDTWGYKSFDDNWKSPQEIYKIKQDLNRIGSNYLLNVGPDYLGRIPAPSVEILEAVGKMQ